MSDDPLITTIHGHVASGNIAAIVSLCEALRDQRDRAELLAAAHLHEVKLLAQRFAAITEPATGKPASERTERPKATSVTKTQHSASAPPREAEASISLDDL